MSYAISLLLVLYCDANRNHPFIFFFCSYIKKEENKKNKKKQASNFYNFLSCKQIVFCFFFIFLTVIPSLEKTWIGNIFCEEKPTDIIELQSLSKINTSLEQIYTK